jgi:hypothetical protein
MRLVNCIKDYLLIGMTLAFLWHFSNIVCFGSHKIMEPNMLVLVVEVGFLVSVLTFGIYMAIKDMG